MGRNGVACVAMVAATISAAALCYSAFWVYQGETVARREAPVVQAPLAQAPKAAPPAPSAPAGEAAVPAAPVAPPPAVAAPVAQSTQAAPVADAVRSPV